MNNKLMKKLLLVILLFPTISAFAQRPPDDRARGVFISFGVGPRLPVAYMSNSSDLGYGLNIEISYTDNEYLPVFLFSKIGFETYPGSQTFYQTTEYSNYSVSVLPIRLGARYYFAPLLQNVALFMPFIEASAGYNYYQILHQFKPSSGRSNYTEDNSKIGLNVGTGISMFLLEILVNYNYFKSAQYIGIDLKVRIPLFISY